MIGIFNRVFATWKAVLLTVIGIVCDPHGDEKVILPPLFLTVTVKLTMPAPETSLCPGVTWIWAEGFAVIEPMPLKLTS